MKSIQLVLLDRDGVINFDSPDYILNPEQWLPIPGSLEAIKRLKDAGIRVAVCSNQSALGRGMIDLKMFESIQQKMITETTQAGGSFDYLTFCPHGPNQGCNCRKPKPGMLLEAINAVAADIDRSKVIMIGDSTRDIEAAAAAGVQGMLVSSGYGNAQQTQEQARAWMPDIMMEDNLAAAVDIILRENACDI